MSNVATRWAWQQDIPDPVAKLVLLALAEHHNGKSGQCNPTLGRISAKTGLGKRAVLYKLKMLRVSGLITMSRNYRRATSYGIGPFMVHEMHHSGGSFMVQSAASCTAPSAPFSKINQEEEEPEERGRARVRAQPADRGTRIPDDFKPDPTIALAEGMTPEQAAKVALNFTDYWKARPGAAGRKLDWNATWRVWCRRDAEMRPNGPDRQRQSTKIHPADYFMSEARKAARQEQGEIFDDDSSDDDAGPFRHIPPSQRN